MKAQQEFFDLLKDMGQGTVLAVAGDIMPFTGDSFNHARFLSQLMFWVEGQENEYVPIPFKEWEDVARLGRYAVEQARCFFVKMGVLDYKVKKDQGTPTVHYRLNFKALITELKKFFKDAVSARRVIFTSYAETFKTLGRGNRINGQTPSYLQYKERYKNENIGQVIKVESKQEKRDKYEKFYL